MNVRKLVVVVTLLILFTMIPCTALKIVPVSTTHPSYSYQLPQSFVPPTVTSPVNKTILEKANTSILFYPVYRIYGGGFALFDNYDNVIFASNDVSIRSPVAYDPSTNTFAAIVPVKVFNPSTGKEYSVYVGNNQVTIFKVQRSGEPVITQIIDLPVSKNILMASVVYYNGTLAVLPNLGILYIYNEMVFPNGSVQFELVKSWNTSVLANYINKTYGLPVFKDTYMDNIWILPSKEIIVSGRFSIPNNASFAYADIYNHNPEGGDVCGDLIIFNLQGDIVKYIPVSKTRLLDIDSLTFTKTSIAAFSNSFDNYAYIDGASVSGSNVSKGDSWPIYMSAASTCDGKYIFAYKNTVNGVGIETRHMALEVWDGTSVVAYFNNSSDILTTNSGIGTTQPRTLQSVANLNSVELMAFPTGMVIYNTKLQKYRILGFDHPAEGRLAAVSKDGKYAVMGNTLYKLEYALSYPAIMYEGNVKIYNNAKDVNLNGTIMYKIPSSARKYGYIMRVLSGSVYIGKIYSKKRVVNIVTNTTARDGNLWKMYKEGLITTFQSTNIPRNGTITNQKITEGYVGNVPNPHIIYYTREYTLKPWLPYISTARVGSAIDIHVPVGKVLPASCYSSLKLNYSLSYATVIPEMSNGKLLGMLFQLCGVGIGRNIVSTLAIEALKQNNVYSELPKLAINALSSAIYLSSTLALSKAMGIVGTGIAVDGAWGFYTSTNIMYDTHLKTLMLVVPEFVSTTTGQKYAVIHLFLPSFANVKLYEERAEEIVTHDGIHNYVIQITTIPAKNWEEFQDTFAHTSPKLLQKMVDLNTGLNVLSARYGVPLSNIKLAKIHIIIESLSEGNVNLWNWLNGGLKFHVITAVATQSGFTGTAVVPAQVITNPSEICEILNPMYVNGFPVRLSPSGDYATAHFILPFKTQYVLINFSKPYYAAMTANLFTQLIAPLHKKNGLYETNFTYSWKYCFNESKIMFVGMPYKMVDAYETVYTTHGNEPVNMTPYMSFITVIKDNSSPTHERYYYGTVTERDLRLIDPHNAGMMETGKKYWIQYWYEKPSIVKGDVKIAVMFNGTTVSNTLPRHARVILYSTRTQTVYGNLQVIVGYEDMKTHQFHTVDSKTFNFALNVYKNSSTYKEWDIQKYVGEAIHQYALGKVGFIKLIGTITKAKYDIVKTNDMQSLIYYPPSTLTKVKPVILTVDVIDAVTRLPVQNATVVCDGKEYFTNTNGTVSIPTTTGYHNLTVSCGIMYTPKKVGVNVYSNMTYFMYLYPANLYVIHPPNGTNTTPWWTRGNTSGIGLPPNAPPLPVGKNNTTGWTVNPILYNPTNRTYLLPVETVVQYLDGMPAGGTEITFINTTNNTIVGKAYTDGTGYYVAYFPYTYNLTINVTNTSLNYSAQKVVLVDHPLIIPFTIPQNSSYFEPEVAINNVSVWIHLGLGEIPGELKMQPVFHSVDCWFYTNVPQSITFEVYFVNTKTNQTVASRNFTVHLYKGFQKVRVFVPVNITDFTTCQVFCKITQYQQDTNPYNNYAVGNVVTFRPWVDIYPTVVWYPVKQKLSDALLPGDTVKVCIGVHVPKHVHLENIHLSYKVMQDVLPKHKMKYLKQNKTTLNSVGQLETIWYNYTLQLPWTDKIKINASVNNAYDLAPDNNNVSATIPLSPDSECVIAKPQTLVVSSNEEVPIRVLIRSNYINIPATISVIDVTDHNTTLNIKTVNLTSPEQSVLISAKAPKVSGVSEKHIWMVTVFVPGDIYLKDSMKEFSVRIWGIPSWIVLGAIFIVVLIVLLLIKHLLTIKPPRTGKYFRRLDINDKKGGKYFRKVK